MSDFITGMLVGASGVLVVVIAVTGGYLLARLNRFGNFD